MNEFKEYLRFTDVEKATEYTSVLDKHNIPFELDDASMRFSLVSTNDPWESQFILKIKDEDIEKVEKVFESEIAKEVKELPPDHYLYTFTDKDILDIIANQNDWTKAEVKLALEIAKQRNIELSAVSIKSAKKVKEETLRLRSTIKSTASWFWVIAAFSIVNSILIRKNVNFQLPGIAITEVFENETAKAYGDLNRVGFIGCILISAIFFLFARYGKRNKWVFLVGLIIYFLDSLLVIASPRWGQIIFIFLALWSMITGLANTFKDAENEMT